MENISPPTQAPLHSRWRKAFRSLEASLPPSRPASASERQRVCTDLDSELDSVLQALTALKEKRNSFPLVSSLPPEILANIFSLLPELYQPFLTKHHPNVRGQVDTVYGWINVTHVCRYWRTVALNWPSLWCDLDQAGYNHLVWDIFLQRAKSAPISIYKHTPNNHSLLAFIPSILNHQHHIRKLHLENVSVDHMQEIISGLAGPLPQLRVLTLFPQTLQLTGQLAPKIPTQLLSDIAPRLERLTLENLAFPWGTGSSTLVELTISRFDNLPPQDLHTFTDVACTLRQMPALTQLELVNQLPDPASITDMDAIRLPHLNRLCLNDKHHAGWHLWSMIEAPSCKTTNITADNDPLGTLAPLVLKGHFVKLLAPFIGVRIYVQSDTISLYLEMSEKTPTGGLWPHDPDRTISLDIGTTDSIRAARLLLSVMGSSAVKELRLGGLSGDVAFFQNMFPSVHALEKLTVHTSADAAAILVALRRVSTDDGDTLLPLLRSLTLDNVNFHTHVDYRGQSISVKCALDHMLQSRQREDGKSLETLTFLFCPYAYPLKSNRHWLEYASYTEVQPDYD